MNLTEWIISVMEQLGYWGIALLMFLDNVFPPIPSEIIMPSAGYSASQGELILVGVIMSGCIGSLLAAACTPPSSSPPWCGGAAGRPPRAWGCSG